MARSVGTGNLTFVNLIAMNKNGMTCEEESEKEDGWTSKGEQHRPASIDPYINGSRQIRDHV